MCKYLIPLARQTRVVRWGIIELSGFIGMNLFLEKCLYWELLMLLMEDWKDAKQSWSLHKNMQHKKTCPYSHLRLKEIWCRTADMSSKVLMNKWRSASSDMEIIFQQTFYCTGQQLERDTLTDKTASVKTCLILSWVKREEEHLPYRNYTVSLFVQETAKSNKLGALVSGFVLSHLLFLDLNQKQLS